MYLKWAILLAVCYLVGSIPFGLLLGLCKGVDIRESGSGNIGATNAGRVLGKPYGYLCFALDLFKGALPVLLGGWWLGYLAGGVTMNASYSGMWIAMAVFAMCGHIFPVWLKFKGGKGVATGFGVILGVFPYLTLAGLGAILIWILCVSVTRYISLSSMIAACSMPVLFFGAYFLYNWSLNAVWPYPLALALMAALIVYKHRGNIQRLLQGEEGKVFSGKKNTEKQEVSES